MNKKILLLSLIVLLGAALRLFQLGSIPAILNRDEAALAYNGYLLSQTGKDEWGKIWPPTLESFGDYKLPGYPLILAILFKFLPLSDGVVRLPSAFFGIILIVVAFQLALHSKLLHRQAFHLATIIAVSPIFMFYSRIAFEANVGLLLFLSSIWLLFFLEAKRYRWQLDLLGLFLSLLAIFTYNTPFLLLPFLVLPLPLIRGLKSWRDWTLPTTGLLAIFVIGFLVFMPITSQKSAVTIFSDPTIWAHYLEYRNNLTGFSRLFSSKYFYYLPSLFKNLRASLSADFVVFQGGTHPWHSLPNFGHLFLSSYLLGLIGLFWSLVEIVYYFYRVFKLKSKWQVLWQRLISLQPLIDNFDKLNRRRKFYSIKQELILVYFLLISLLPAIITVDAPHATRSLLFFFLLSIFAVIGLEDFYHWPVIHKHLHKESFLTWGVMIILAVEAVIYHHSYFVKYPTIQPDSLQVGFEQTVSNLEANYQDKQVAIVDSGGYHYILTAWYAKIPPQIFFETVIKQLPNRIGFRYGQQVGNYHFIAEAADRSETEEVLVEWVGGKWQITEY